MQKNIIQKTSPAQLNSFIPVRDAKITTEVKVFHKNLIKFTIGKQSYSAQELIDKPIGDMR